MNQILSTFWCNKININTSVTIFVISLDWRTNWFVDAFSLSWVVILILCASGGNQNTLFSCVIEYLIICTVHSALENSIVINISWRTISTLTSVVVEIHTSCTVCIDKLTNFSGIVIILARFAIPTKTSRVVKILSRCTCKCFLFTQVSILIIHISLWTGHTLTGIIVKILIIRAFFYSFFTLLGGYVIKILSRASVQTTMSCRVVIIIIRTKLNAFLSGLVKRLILLT